MPSCERILAENEYIFSLEEIFRGRPVVESALAHSIVNDGLESTELYCTPIERLISKIKVSLKCNRIGR